MDSNKVPATALASEMTLNPAVSTLAEDELYHKYSSRQLVQEQIGLDDFAAFVLSLRPRCVHDFKPMCYLLQSLLQNVINGKIQFFNDELRRLRDEILRMSKLAEDRDAENKSKNMSSIIANWKSAMRQSAKMAATEDHMAYLVKQAVPADPGLKGSTTTRFHQSLIAKRI